MDEPVAVKLGAGSNSSKGKPAGVRFAKMQSRVVPEQAITAGPEGCTLDKQGGVSQ